MFCNQCGIEQAASATYCPACGRKLFRSTLPLRATAATPRTVTAGARDAFRSIARVLAGQDVRAGALAWDVAAIWLLVSVGASPLSLLKRRPIPVDFDLAQTLLVGVLCVVGFAISAASTERTRMAKHVAHVTICVWLMNFTMVGAFAPWSSSLWALNLLFIAACAAIGLGIGVNVVDHRLGRMREAVRPPAAPR